MSENPYQPLRAEIERVREEAPTIKSFLLRPEKPLEFKAGQFVEITVPGVGEAPFTPSSSPLERETLEVTVMKVGKVTSALHQFKEKEVVGVRGPYGYPYPLKEFENKEILIVGGGVGIAPLRSLLLALCEEKEKYKKIWLLYGARTPQDIVYKEYVLKKWPTEYADKLLCRLTVDKAEGEWKGKVGVVTTLLDGMGEEIKNISQVIAVVCGPSVMMKFTTLKLLDMGIRPENIYLSMEKNMSCGLGKCGHCMIGRYLVCKDGPVFTYAQLKDVPEVWD